MTSEDRRLPDMDAMRRTKERLDAAPTEASTSFTSVTEWREGARSVTRVRDFHVATDEPSVLGGDDSDPDPMELLLAALGACLTIGWVKQAKLRGVTVRNLRVTVRAPFDMRGYLEEGAAVRPGFGELAYDVEVDSDADAVTLAEIMAAAERSSPLFDNILNHTPLRGAIRPIS
ncbi:MAG: OsmC family protein [Rhodospirillales bacterium]